MARMFYTTCDNGDGSSSVEFCESQEIIDILEENDFETYGAGEGGSWFDYEGTTDIVPMTMADLVKLGYVEGDK